MPNVCYCTRPCGDAFACTACADQAHADLLQLARSCWGLDQHRTTVRGVTYDASSKASERPLPIDPRIRDAADAVHNLLVGMARVVWDERPEVASTLGANSSTAAIAIWLTAHVGWMRWKETCQDDWRQIRQARERIASIVDPPPEKVYLGDCRHCETAILATVVHSATVACDECGEGNNAADLTEAMLAKVDHHIATIGEVLGLLRKAGEPVVSERTVRRLIDAYQIKPAAKLTIVRSDGRPTTADGWRVRDIRGLLERAK